MSPNMEHVQDYRPSSNSIHVKNPKCPWKKGSRLGIGSFGTVYGAVDRTYPNTGKYSIVRGMRNHSKTDLHEQTVDALRKGDGLFFAVKEVSVLEQDKQNPQALDQLKQEVEMLKKFKHENIVQYLGTDETLDKLYIFLEYVELGSLAAVYKQFELEDSQISKFTRDILKGLEYLHGQKILHRDIKCANILVDRNGTCKLADFGMAKQISTLNLTKSCKGTVHWMAPEMICPRKGGYGTPADIWSLGCSVLEMATRASPFGDLEWCQVMYQVGRGKSPPIPCSVSKRLRDFIKRCFVIDPKKRPTATQLLKHPFIVEGMQNAIFDNPLPLAMQDFKKRKFEAPVGEISPELDTQGDSQNREFVQYRRYWPSLRRMLVRCASDSSNFTTEFELDNSSESTEDTFIPSVNSNDWVPMEMENLENEQTAQQMVKIVRHLRQLCLAVDKGCPGLSRDNGSGSPVTLDTGCSQLQRFNGSGSPVPLPIANPALN